MTRGWEAKSRPWPMLDSITIATMAIVVHVHHDIADIPSVVLCCAVSVPLRLISFLQASQEPGSMQHMAGAGGR
jgi:hypothetical protein